MRHGIPAYRLSRRVLDAEIARIVALGVELHCGQPCAPATRWTRWPARTMPCSWPWVRSSPRHCRRSTARRPWFMDGAGYLAACSRGAPPALGPRVVVVGGGSAAIDVARSARRQGHAVTLLALERRDRRCRRSATRSTRRWKRASRWSTGRSCSVDEGARRRRRGADAAVPPGGLRAGAERGRFERAPVEGSDFTLAADAVLAAIGQDARLRPGRRLRRRGALLWTDAAGPDQRCAASGPVATWPAWRASSPRRWAWAHAPPGPSTRGCAARRAGPAGSTPARAEAVVPLSAISLHYHPARARAGSPRATAAERVADQAEVQLGLDRRPGVGRGAALLLVRHCIHCDQCVTYCPDLAVQRVDAVATA
jgi:NADPH-dependent glutamate synthase beta subunit-like oxidoreductase